MSFVFWDIETRSAASLPAVGAWNYAAHSSTQPLCLFIAVNDDEPLRWLPGDPVPAPLFEVAQDPEHWKLIAHNHEFERAILELILVPRYGFPAISLEAQYCTQQLAAANAYPAELGLLSQALGLPYRKDPIAAKAMRESPVRASHAAAKIGMCCIGMTIRSSTSSSAPAAGST
jgi:hypothetical protein